MNFDIESFKWAIAERESSQNYRATSKPSKNGDRAYGKYQVMGKNIPAWSRQVLGYPMSIKEFINNPEAQETIAHSMLTQIAEKYPNGEDVASIWFSGKPHAGNNRQDVYRTKVPDYVREVANYYSQHQQTTKQANDLETRLQQAESEAKQQYDLLSRLEAAEKEYKATQPVNTDTQANGNTDTQENRPSLLNRIVDFKDKVLGAPVKAFNALYAPEGLAPTPEQEARNIVSENAPNLTNAPIQDSNQSTAMDVATNFNNTVTQAFGGIPQRVAKVSDAVAGTNLKPQVDNYLASEQLKADKAAVSSPLASAIGTTAGAVGSSIPYAAVTGGGATIPQAMTSGYLSGVGATHDSEGQSQTRGLIGIGAGLALGGLSKGLQSASGLNNPAAPKILAGGKEFDIPINSADIAPTSTFKPISENVLENTLGAGVKTFRNTQAQATTKAVDKIVGDLTGGAKVATPGDVIKSMQASAAHLDTVKASLFNKRDALAVAENVQVKPAAFTASLDEQIAKLSKMGQTAEVKGLIKELNALRIADVVSPYDVVKTRAQQLGAMTEAEGLRGNITKQLYKSINSDLDNSTGSTAFNKANKQAVDFHKNAYLPIKKNQQLQSVIKGDVPEKDLLNKFTSDTFVKDAKPLLGSKTKQVVNSAILNGAKQDATNPASELVSNKAFAKEIEKYQYSNPQLVGQSNTDKLSRFNDVLRSTSRSYESAANPQTGATVNKIATGSVPLAVAGSAALSPATAITGAGIYGTGALLGRLSNHPELFQSIAKKSIPVAQFGTPLTGILTGRITRKKGSK